MKVTYDELEEMITEEFEFRAEEAIAEIRDKIHKHRKIIKERVIKDELIQVEVDEKSSQLRKMVDDEVCCIEDVLFNFDRFYIDNQIDEDELYFDLFDFEEGLKSTIDAKNFIYDITELAKEMAEIQLGYKKAA